jgi:hypothetical protein
MEATMTDSTTLAALAREFIANLRACGHTPYAEGGKFGISLGTHKSERPYSDFMLGFDHTPFGEVIRRHEFLTAAMEEEQWARGGSNDRDAN